METPAVTPAIGNAVPHRHQLRKTVVVFGASWCKPGSELYEESVRLGRGIAEAGFKLVNGGYSGTMEGTAKGAAEVPHSLREGVIVPDLFPTRFVGGNEFLTSAVPTSSLLQRIETMVIQSDFFVVMNGTLGTITELSLIWNLAALGVGSPVILCYRNPWEGVVKGIAEMLRLPEEHRARIRYVDGHEEAMHIIQTEYNLRSQAAAATAGHQIRDEKAHAHDWPAPVERQ